MRRMAGSVQMAQLAGVCALLIAAATIAEDKSESSLTTNCAPSLVAAYQNGTLPADFLDLCPAAPGADLDWLTSIELGDDVDILRYWDLLGVAADLDKPVGLSLLDHGVLPAIVAETEAHKPQPSDWFERLRAWLRRWLENQGHDVDLEWLQRLLDRVTPPDWAVEVLLRITVVVVLVSALYIVLREIELPRGWRKQRWRGSKPRVEPPPSQIASEALSWESALAARPGDRPGALLRWLFRELSAHGLLPDDRCMTNREQLARLALARSDLRIDFHAIIDLVEPLMFGSSTPDSATLSALETRVAAFHEHVMAT